MSQNPYQPHQNPNDLHKGWYARGFIPHFDQPGLIQSITFRLADSLPANIIESLNQEKLTDLEKHQRIETYMDAGYGQCHLRHPQIGQLVQNALLNFDGQRYHLLAWVIMPNHVHVLIKIIERHPLRKIIQSWKSFTAHQANEILNRNGRFWFPEYFDRFIRDEQHFKNVIHYIHENPVKAGLVEKPVDWPFSSAKYWPEMERGRLVRQTKTGGTPVLPEETS